MLRDGLLATSSRTSHDVAETQVNDNCTNDAMISSQRTQPVSDGLWEKSIENMRSLPCSNKRLVPDNVERIFSMSAISHEELCWESLEDDLFILLSGNQDHLELFRQLHADHNMNRPSILTRLAYIVSHREANNACYYYDCISVLASFVAVASWSGKNQKLAVLRTLMQCRGPPTALWQHSERIIEDTLEFLLTKDHEWDYPPHSEMVLMSELRAMCLYCLNKEERQRRLVESRGDALVILISGCAKLIERGISEAMLPLIHTQLDKIVRSLKLRIKPNVDPLMVSRDAVVAMAYTNTAKQTSEMLYQNAQFFAQNVKNVAADFFTTLASTMDDAGIVEIIIPHSPSREAFKVVGKVCVTTIGAIAIVGEAVIQGTRAVVEGTAYATADVIEHKYGTTVAQVVRDTGDTASNVMGAFGQVAFLKARVVAKAVAKTNGKTKVNEEAAVAARTLRSFENRSKVMMHCLVRGEHKDVLILVPADPETSIVPHSDNSAV